MHWFEKWLFPPVCVLSGESLDFSAEVDLTERYLQQFRRAELVCPICAENSPMGLLCGQCQQNRPSFDGMQAVFDFEGDLRQLILDFKYHPAPYLGKVLAKIAQPYFRPGQAQVLIPVPIHTQRLSERGFNQANILAEYWGQAFNLPVRPHGLTRIRPTETQTHLNAEQRRHNLRNAFALDEAAFEGLSHIILVDDVVTTGATAEALAKLIKSKTQVKIVEVWAVAKTR